MKDPYQDEDFLALREAWWKSQTLKEDADFARMMADRMEELGGTYADDFRKYADNMENKKQ